MKICFIVTQTDQINLGVEMISQETSSFTSSRCFNSSNRSSVSPVLQMQITDQREHIWIGFQYHRVTFSHFQFKPVNLEITGTSNSSLVLFFL